MGMVRVSDDTAKKLKKIGDGRSMTATIEMLIEKVTEREDEKVMEAINNLGGKIDAVERALKDMQVYKPDPVVVPTSVHSVSPATVTYEDDYKPDRTYTEILEEMKQLREELKTLDDDDPRRKEIENRLRADSVDLSLLED